MYIPPVLLSSLNSPSSNLQSIQLLIYMHLLKRLLYELSLLFYYFGIMYTHFETLLMLKEGEFTG